MFSSVSMLPALGFLGGGGFGGGGGIGIGFSLLSGLVGQLFGAQQNGLGFGEDLAYTDHTLQGVPDLGSYGAFNGYFGAGQPPANFNPAVSAAAYPSYGNAYPTYSNSYFGQSGYQFGSHGAHYSAGSQPSQPTQHTYFLPKTDARDAVVKVQIQGDLSAYFQKFSSQFGGQQQQAYVDPFGSSLNYSTQLPSYGAVMSPQSNFFFNGQGSFFGHASTLQGHQSGQVGWLKNPPLKVRHVHHHVFHLPQGTYGGPPVTPPSDPYAPSTPAPSPTTPPVAHNPDPYKPAPAPAPVPPAAPAPAPPAAAPPKQTPKVFGLTPHVDTAADWPAASAAVKERLVGNASVAERYHFGGQDPRTNSDGFQAERMGAWHVFQQNGTLQLDVDSARFFTVNNDGSRNYRFSVSEVAALERQAPDLARGSQLVADFMSQLGLPVTPTRFADRHPTVNTQAPLPHPGIGAVELLPAAATGFTRPQPSNSVFG